MSRVRMNWRGDEVRRDVVGRVLIPALTEFGLEVEGAAKRELYPGHGVVTGTLRRSIHTAEPGHAWDGDTGGPAGRAAEAADGVVKIEIGSGLEYARAVHDGHHSFEGYHYLTNALEAVRGRLVEILERYRRVL